MRGFGNVLLLEHNMDLMNSIFSAFISSEMVGAVNDEGGINMSKNFRSITVLTICVMMFSVVQPVHASIDVETKDNKTSVSVNPSTSGAEKGAAAGGVIGSAVAGGTATAFAAYGAMAGSAVPIVGTLTGAAVGAIVGGIAGWILGPAD